MSLVPIPGRPGKFYDRSTGKVQTITNARETDRYDTAEKASGAITAGQTMKFFSQSNTNKNELDFNLPEAGKLVTGSERMILERIGAAVQPANGTVIALPRDVKALVAHAFLEVRVNKMVLEDGPLEKFPSGYGLAGQTTENDAGMVTVGVPSTAAQVKFIEQQVITDDHTIAGVITFQGRTWLTTSTLPTLNNDVVVRLYMHGLLEAAATNN